MKDREIERKFLVEKLPDNMNLAAYPHEKIFQGYLGYSEEYAIRLRHKGEKYILSYKAATDHAFEEIELECDLTQNQFDTLWPGTEERRLEKTRYKIPLDQYIIELDIFEGENAGHMFAEVEFESLKEAQGFVPPEWFGDEVTGNSSYDNGYIAIHGFLDTEASCPAKVFQGNIFSVWQWQQKLFDGSTATFEKLRRPNTAQVIAVVGQKILMQDEQQPQMDNVIPSIPGGRFDDGEEAIDAIKRELLEETGYVSDHWVLWNETRPVFKIDWTVFTFIAKNCRLEKEPHLDPGEKITTKLVAYDEFMEIATENKAFYSPEIVAELLRIRLDTKKEADFKKMLFG